MIPPPLIPAEQCTNGRLKVLPCVHAVKSAFLVCGLLLATQALAGWSQVVETEKSVYYIDVTTLRVNGTVRRIWVLNDRKAPDEDGDLSSRALVEFDCKEDRMRTLQIAHFTKNMATGKASGSKDEPDSWTYVAPRTSAQSSLKHVCQLARP